MEKLECCRRRRWLEEVDEEKVKKEVVVMEVQMERARGDGGD